MFDAARVKDQCVEWIRDFFENNGKECNAIVGISGGKDSSIVAALCVEALGKERVIGVLMPNGVQHDIDAARLLVKHLGIRNYEVNIKDAVEGVLKNMPEGMEITPQTIQNIPPRIRMATLYAIGQSNNGRLCRLFHEVRRFRRRFQSLLVYHGDRDEADRSPPGSSEGTCREDSDRRSLR